MGEGSPRRTGDRSPYGASDGSPRATGRGKPRVVGKEGPKAARRTEVDYGGAETSSAEYGSRPYGYAWGLGQVPPVQEVEPADKTISTLVLELLCCSFLIFLATDEPI